MKSNFLKTIIATFLGILLSSSSSFAQIPAWSWVKRTGGGFEDRGKGIVADSSGNVFVTGSFESQNIDFGAFLLNNPNFAASSMFIAKFNSQGVNLWLKLVPGRGETSDICLDKMGNIFVTGYERSSGNFSAFVAKFDPTGNLVWLNSIATTFTQSFSNGVATDTIGNVYITGYFQGATLNFGSITLNNSSGGYQSMFIAKYTSTGNVLWAETAIGRAVSNEIHIDDSLNIFITGYYEGGTLSIGSNVFNQIASYAATFIAKYNSSGSVLWAKSISCNYEVFGNNITTDKSKNIILTGYTQGIDTLFFDANVYVLVPNRDDVSYIAMFDSLGTPKWAQSSLGADLYLYGLGYEIAIDSSNNIYWACSFRSPTLTFGTTTLNGFGGLDIFIVKFDSLGNVIWAQSAGGADDDRVNGLTVTNDGSIFVTGSYKADPMTIGGNVLINNGYNDIYVARLCQAALPIAQPTVAANGPTNFCNGDTVTLTSSSANSYFWSNGLNTQSIAVNTTGNYSVITADLNGCSSARSPITNVNAYSNPNVNISQSGNTLSVNNFNCSYLWSTGDTTRTIICTGTGIYTVLVTDINGCTGTASRNVFSCTITDINEINYSVQLRISPNPFDNETIISLSNNLENSSLIVYNSIGEEVKKMDNLRGTSIIFKRDNLPAGLYFVRLSQGEKIFALSKLIIID